MSTLSARQPYPSDVSDEEWHFVAPYPALLREDGAEWQLLPHDLARWDLESGTVRYVNWYTRK